MTETNFRRLLLVLLAGLAAPLTVPEPGAATGEEVCLGDCNDDEEVVTSELIRGVRIALGSAEPASCPSFGSDGNGAATVAELLHAVRNSLQGCLSPGDSTPTPTRTRTPGPSETPGTPPTPAPGPAITLFAVTRADGFLVDPIDDDAEVPIYERPLGSGFNLVVEAGTGPGGGTVGVTTLDDSGPPDLQVQATRRLGDGDPRVCDAQPPAGGIPAIDPPRFDDSPFVTTTLNDFGCRFLDGRGQTRGRGCNEENGCVAFANGESGCVSRQTRRQFCATVDASMAFPLGDTLVTVRVRDTEGRLGDAASLIVRVLNE